MTPARIPMSFMAAALLAVTVPLAAGCSADSDPKDDPATGSLVFPLLQPGPDGALYHLTNATFDLVESTTGSTRTIDGSGNQSTVSVPFLQPGVFFVTLRDGWSLEKSDDAGATFVPVSALLGSLNPTGFRVLANQPVIVEFDFLVREPSGTLELKLGVVPDPRELAGGIVVDTASDGLADYAIRNRALDFGVFFKLASIVKVTLADGTKQRIYTAGPSGTPGPIPPDGSAVAAEFYNDNIGALAGVVGPVFTGGSLQYTVSAKPDGTVELVGSLVSNSDIGELDFGPSAIDAATSPTIGADGFPTDEFFYDSGSPFTLTTAQGTMSGTLRVRHLVP